MMIKMRGLVAGAALALVATNASCLKRRQPLYEGPAHSLLIPFDNGEQPNRLSVLPTRGVRVFVDRLKKANPDVRWSDAASAGAFLARHISGLKQVKDSDHEARLRKENSYFARIRKAQVITPDIFLDYESSFCVERSVFLVSCLRHLGFDSHILLLEERYNRLESDRHVLVKVRAGRGALYLDPTYGITADDLKGYLSSYLSAVGRDRRQKRTFIYSPIPYTDELGRRYLSPGREAGLDNDFENLRNEID